MLFFQNFIHDRFIVMKKSDYNKTLTIYFVLKLRNKKRDNY